MKYGTDLDTCPNCLTNLSEVYGCKCLQHDKECPNCGMTVIRTPLGDSIVALALDFTDTHSQSGKSRIGALVSDLEKGTGHGTV